jgi:magnesium-transporting ATPase (P-type)
MVLGEDNTYFHTDLYPCTFSKLIEYWRSTWYQRTNSNTDPNFPFGFVQVKVFQLIISIFYCFSFSYQRELEILMSREDFHGFVGIKHLMLDMCQTILYQMFLWLLQWIYLMMEHRKNNNPEL